MDTWLGAWCAGSERAAALEHAQAASTAKRRRVEPAGHADTQVGSSGSGWECWPDQDNLELSVLPKGTPLTAWCLLPCFLHAVILAAGSVALVKDGGVAAAAGRGARAKYAIDMSHPGVQGRCRVGIAFTSSTCPHWSLCWWTTCVPGSMASPASSQVSIAPAAVLSGGW